jgi:hypothetical protein
LGFIAGSLIALTDHTWFWIGSLAEAPRFTLDMNDTSPSLNQVDQNQEQAQSLNDENMLSPPLHDVKDGKRTARKRRSKPKTKVHKEGTPGALTT